MMRHLDAARLELRRALEEHEGSGELDKLTRLILEAVTAITAARREALRVESYQGHFGGGGDQRFVVDLGPDRPELKVCPEQVSEGAA